MENGGQKAAAKFLDALVKSVQSLCHGYLEFQSGIEIVGFINLSVDKEKSVDCVLKEKVCKTAENATSFISNSYHAKPLSEETFCARKQSQSSVNSSSSNRSSRDARVSEFSHPSRSGLKRRRFEDHRGEVFSKKSSSHLHRSSSENLHVDSSVSVDSSEAEQGENAGRGSRSAEDMDQVNLTGSGIVLEPVDDQDCGGEESNDFDVTFIKEEFVEDENEFDSSANSSQSVAMDQYRRGPNSAAPFSTQSSVDLAGGFKVEPGDHHDNQPIVAFQPQPGSSSMAGLKSWPVGGHFSDDGYTSSRANTFHHHRHHQPLPSMSHKDLQQRVSHDGKLFCCVYCPATFLTNSGLWKHKNIIHFNRKETHVCRFCGKGFLDRTHYVDHLNMHLNIRQHQCPHCAHTFTHKTSLKLHIRSKHGKFNEEHEEPGI